MLPPDPQTAANHWSVIWNMHSYIHELCTRVLHLFHLLARCDLRISPADPSAPTSQTHYTFRHSHSAVAERLLSRLSASASLLSSLSSAVASSSADPQRLSSSSRKTRPRRRRVCRPITSRAGRRAAFRCLAVRSASLCLETVRQ